MKPLLHSSSIVEISKPEEAVTPDLVQSSDLTLVTEEHVSTLEELATACTTEQETSCPFWQVFTSTFVTIFLAEIGDKTQVSTLLMSAEFHKPWVVFLGAGTALVATTLIGVWVGQWLSSRLSPRTLDVAAGIMLALISASLIWEVFQM